MAFPHSHIAGYSTLGNIALTVDGSGGSDTPTSTRPSRILKGDHSSEPFATIQAALNSLPKTISHVVTVDVAAGSYQGFGMEGFNATYPGYVMVRGVQDLVTPTTGPATGTATSGTVNTLTLTGAAWTADDFVGKFCKIISGTGAGQHFIIASNTTDTLRFAARMSPAPDATSVFEITEPKTLITSNGIFSSGIYVSGGFGFTYVYDFHVEGTTYGVNQLWTNGTLSLARVTVKNSYYNFVAQEAKKCAWNQIGSLGSTSYGITFLVVEFAGNPSYEKGWLAINAGAGADGIYFSACKFGGCQGIYVKGCGNNGINIDNSVVSLYYIVADNNLDGIWASRSKSILYNVSCNNNTKRGISSDYGSRIDLQNTVTGSGNGEWGVNAGVGVGGLVALTSLPTITGTLGDATVDGTTALVWSSDLAVKNDYAYFLARDARIVRAV